MYLNEAQVSLTGYVATQPLIRSTPSGAVNVSMRVAWTPRKQDRATGEWVDGNTSYVTVICWRKLASNAGVCVRKGDPVLVKGRLSIREFDDKQGVRRTAVEVEASSVGHDLSRGVAQFQRVRPQTGMTAAEYAAAQGQSPAGAGIAGDGNGSGPANGLAMANGSTGLNGSSGPNGSVGPDGSASADAHAVDGSVEGEPMLELTENGFSASPGSTDEAPEPSTEAAESRELEAVGAPF